jgi:Mn2+/Fe2+ NRAMP family transporter
LRGTKQPKSWWKVLGPGIVSGASDNDPTTVASLAVIGSTTTYGLSWLVLLVIPMLSVVQAISAQVGLVTNTGLECVVRKRYGKGWAFLALASVLIVNLLTLAADLEGGGAALSLLTNVDYRWFIIPLAASAGYMLIRGNYKEIQRALVYLPLIFLSYVAAAFLAHPNWSDVLIHSFHIGLLRVQWCQELLPFSVPRLQHMRTCGKRSRCQRKKTHSRVWG